MGLGKKIYNFDYILFFTTVTLTVLGILFIYSANLNNTYLSFEYIKQIIFMIIGLILLFVIIMFSTKRLYDYIIPIYIVLLIGVFITIFFPYVKGQRRFSLFGISIHFSEYIKIATIVFLSRYYSQNSKVIKEFKTFIIGGCIAFLPVSFIMLHPDLGTALVFIPIFLGISLIAGIKKRYILYVVLFGLSAGSIPVLTTINSLFFQNENEIIYLLTDSRYIIIVLSVIFITIVICLLAFFDIIKGVSGKFKLIFYWYVYFTSILLLGLSLSFPINKYVLEDYQKDRLLIFFKPEVDPRDKGYNVIQSMTTIGNGGITGKGWLKGQMIHNHFLPEKSTDFIFPVIAEEWGFLGSVFIILLFALMFYRSFLILYNSKDYFSALIVSGILSMLLFHILENIGMCIGIMPITGIPLPFLSAGGSFLLTCYISIGLILNIDLNRFNY